jgi:membrane-bound lytic murein transglycosylase A
VSRRARWWAWALLLLASLLAPLAAYLLRPPPPPRLTLKQADFAELDGWHDDTLAAGLSAFLRSCAIMLGKPDNTAVSPRTPVDFGTVAEWRPICAAAAALSPGDDAAARAFFEQAFTPLLAGNNGDSKGLFTGYFEITLDGARHPGGPYRVPLYRRPPDSLRTQYTRAEIDDGALGGHDLELLWVDDPVGAFFLEIQGSGLIRLHEGGSTRVGYADSNGKPYVAVGRLLVEQGIMPKEQVTMASIADWMKANPKEGAALRRTNPSYVFFREITGPGPIGAEQTVLTAGRSLAVDRHFLALGLPIWLDAKQRFTAGDIRRLVVAQDTGGAIKGPVRGDLFWGHGKAAADGAGAMNAYGHYYLLLPKAVAARAAGD